MEYGIGNGKISIDDFEESGMLNMTIINGSGNIEHIETFVHIGKVEYTFVDWRS